MLGKRIISTLLLVFMLVSSMTLVISAADGGAGEGEGTDAPVYEYNTSRLKPTINYLTGELLDEKLNPIAGTKVDTKEEKLETMDLRLEQYGYRIYVDEYSGEVAIECIATGDVMFSNPYDTSSNPALTPEDKAKNLSQFLISYVDTSNNNAPGNYTSYQHAVLGGAKLDAKLDPKKITQSQITIKYIKNGVRVDYSIGRLDTRYLVPQAISKENFENKILNVAIEAGCTSFQETQLKSYFDLKDVEAHVAKFSKDPAKAEEEREKFLQQFPVAKNGPVYLFNGGPDTEYRAIEAIIKQYCPDYTYEELDTEHLRLNFTPENKNVALFNIALEYTIDEKGFTVRVPANGIRFDESIYRLESIEILPFMGAGHNPNAGYTFFPDGSGALFDFQELAKKSTDTFFYGDVYGEDFAYYNVGTGAPHNEVVRYPVFGVKEDITQEDGSVDSRGFVAIVEEGDAMMMLYSHHSIKPSGYNTVRMQVNPRPYDEYELSSAISVSGAGKWTVVSPRKYTGNFTVRYIMLTDPDDISAGKGKYETSYVGMAKAYQQYLIDKGVLTKLTAADIKEDIPLYIETFGAIETTEKFLTLPYDTMKALTSFDDIRKMYEDLEGYGVDNINFILTGYTKGGLNVDKVPYNLKWDGSVQKEMKFEELIAYAKEKDFGIYPDFDFAFVGDDGMFDGLTLRDHAVQSIDGRYTSKSEYSATRQTYVSYFELVISPAYFSHFYEKLTKNYSKYEPIGISVSTLGSYLNSDFDEDEPYHREDSKEFTVEAFKYFDENYNKVMTSGGNAYTWKYVDYITDIATDSSRHARSAATVPFLGIVLHGYVQTAGEPINMEGDIEYAMLRAIENGTSLKFILSYQNTEKLKLYESTSEYYSVRYDIWLADLVKYYNELNSLLKDVQLSTIDEHKFLDGIRVPNNDEIIKDSNSEIANAIQKEIEDAANEKEALRLKLQTIRKNIVALEDLFTDEDEHGNLIAVADPGNINAKYAATSAAKEKLDKNITNLNDRKVKLDAAKAKYEADPSDGNLALLTTAEKAYVNELSTLKTNYDAYVSEMNSVIALGESYLAMYEFSVDNFDMLSEHKAYPDDIITALKTKRDNLKVYYDDLKDFVDNTVKKDLKDTVSGIEVEYADLLMPKEEEKVEVETVFNPYAAATNSIVYEKYKSEKGEELILVLNFNNYAVKVEIGGAYYTIDAHGYIVMN